MNTNDVRGLYKALLVLFLCPKKITPAGIYRERKMSIYVYILGIPFVSITH